MTVSTISHLPARASAEKTLATFERARQYARAAHSAATRRAYASAMRIFEAWCDRHGTGALPATPQTITLYVTELAQGSKLATIRRHLAAIAFAHKEYSLASPVSHEIVRRVVRGVARTNGAAQVKKTAITVDVLRAMLLAVRGNALKVARDRALLLLGFAGAFRRSELAALNVTDLRWSRDGLLVTIRRSKTDQTGQSVEIAIPYVATESLCAARAVREWLNAADITAGPVFRTFSLQSRLGDRRIDGRDVANLVQHLARRANVEGDFAAHSLRAGFATSAAKAKVPLDSIARTTRHRSLTVLMGYVRPALAFDDVAIASIIH